MEDEIQQLRDEIDSKRVQLRELVAKDRQERASADAQQELEQMTPEHRAAIIQAIGIGSGGGVNGE